MTERDEMLAGDLYLASDPELVHARSRARRLARRLSDADPDDVATRTAILRELLGAVGAGAWVEPPLFVDHGAHVSLGARAYLDTGCVLLDCGRIEIGDDAFLGPGVHVYTATQDVPARCVAAGNPCRVVRRLG